MFTFGSLFSGIGGLDLGLERANMVCQWQVENEEFCKKVLAKHWPDVARYGDVRTVGKHNLQQVDLIAGGMPCQPHSLAGERKASADERNLWPEFYRIICELRPTWVLVENVVGLLSSESGGFFSGVLRDLAQARYDAEWFCLRASDFGAPHQRERVFIVAHTSSCRLEEQQDTGWTNDQPDSSGPLAYSYSDRQWQWAYQQKRFAQCQGAPDPRNDGAQGTMAYSYSSRLEEWHGCADKRRACTATDKCCAGKSQSILGGVLDGLSSGLDRYRWPARPGEQQYEWEPPRTTIERIPNRGKRLKALGNAVVPQVAEYIGRCILSVEEANHE